MEVSRCLSAETELKFLNDKYEENGGQLIVLYGRRRVGKPKLFREFCKGKPHAFFPVRRQQTQYSFETFSIRMMKEDIPAKRLYLCVYRLGESVSGRT